MNLKFSRNALIATVAVLCLLAVPAVFAADITVDDDCSLENAILSAHGQSQTAPLDSCEAGDDDATGADTITIDLSATTEGVLTISATISITSDVIIEGQGATIEGDRSFRIFNVTSGSLELRNLTVSKGHSNGHGGGIKVHSSELTLNNSVVSDNEAHENGGGIHAQNSDVTLTNSAVSNNTLDASGSGKGGGIHFSSSGAHSLVIDRSGLDGNSAQGDGGGLYLRSGSATISNATFGGNTTDGNGGGIYNDSTATLTHVTATGNTAASGGGLYDADQLHLRNSILSGNSVDDCFGTLNTNIANLIKDNSCGHDELSADPKLLAMSGLPVYYALPSDSPAVDRASADHCLPTDQRGILRSANQCDVGAAEYQAGAFAFQIQSARLASAELEAEGGSGDGSTQPDIPATPKPSTCLEPPEGVTLSGFHNSTQCQQRDARGIANQTVLDHGFIMAVDIWGWVPNPVRICFKSGSENTIILLDAATSPRSIVPLATDIEGDSICATVDRAGTAVLISSGFLNAEYVGTAEIPLSNCTVTTADYVNMRDAPAGDNVIYIIPNNISLTALAKTTGWYQVSYAGAVGWVSADYATASDSCQ